MRFLPASGLVVVVAKFYQHIKVTPLNYYSPKPCVAGFKNFGNGQTPMTGSKQ